MDIITPIAIVVAAVIGPVIAAWVNRPRSAPPPDNVHGTDETNDTKPDGK
jgi:hypothetical protein